MAESTQITAYRGRTQDWTIALYQSDGSTGIALNTNDVVRIKIGRGASTPNLDLTSATPTANNSSVTITSTVAPAAVTLRLAQDDLTALVAGPYDVEIIVVDTSEAAPLNAMKHVQYAVLQVIEAMAGNSGT